MIIVGRWEWVGVDGKGVGRGKKNYLRCNSDEM
jgi:hypothetical protein